MNKCLWRLILVTGPALILAGCGGNRETKDALQKASALEAQSQYHDANEVLVSALQAREDKIHGNETAPADQASVDALTKKVEADPEILTMERAQIPLYLHMDKADLASAVDNDILAGDPADTTVTNLLRDPDPAMRTGAARILGLVGKPESIDALAATTKDSDQDVRRAAVTSLGMIKDPRSVAPLLSALKDPYWFVRSEAAEALGQKHDSLAIKPLLDTMADSDATVQGAAATALLFLSKEPGVPADEFASHLNDPNEKIVLISAVCLATMKDPRAVPVLMKLVASPDPTIRLDAVKGLGETGDPSVIPTLRETLKDPDINMRGWSIIGLGKLKDQGSLSVLRAIANDPTGSLKIQAAAKAAADHIAGNPPPPPGT